MQRVLEPELMLDKDQVLAFTNAKKDYGIKGFLELYQKCINLKSGKIVDIGSGPAQYLLELEKKYPDLEIIGYDGSESMVNTANSLIGNQKSKIIIRHKSMYEIVDTADCVISTNTLHHLHDPTIFWDCVKRISSRCLIFDLLRPDNNTQARDIVEHYAADESPIFKDDYYNSLLAAFSEEEIADQLKSTNLKYDIIYGHFKFVRCIAIYGDL